MLLPRHESRPVPELTPVHKAYKLALSQEPVTVPGWRPRLGAILIL
jgi:hypothetical protein